MKNKLLIILLLIVTVAHSQTRQPFKNIGKEVKVVTLTNGEYDEFFDEDSIQRIGSALVNINTMKVVRMNLTKEEKRQLDNAKSSRFLSVDPLTSSYPMLTPYQYASNRPIDGIDLDGLEYLPYGESMYRFDTKIENGTASTVVKSVYENIPSSLRSPQTHDFKTVYGGPVGPSGADLTPPSNGWILPTGRYNHPSPKTFYGTAAEGRSTNGIESLKGNAAPTGTSVNAGNINSTAGVLGASGLGGLIANQINAITWRALEKESRFRKGFYNATNQVDFNNSEQNKSFSGAVLNYQDRSNLINFITDGYLPINSINQAGFSNEQKLTVLGQNLDIANTGLQTIGQLNNLNPSAIKLQKATVDNVNGLLKQYKDLGGDAKKYDTMKDYLTPSSN